jgi:SNF2 family DNA or RNA helicase
VKLRNYQDESIDFGILKKTPYHAIDLGLGKTAIAIKTHEYIDEKPIVFAPLRVAQHTWPKEIEKWSPNSHFEICHGANKEAAILSDPDFLIVNYDTIPWMYKYLADMSVAELRRKWRRRPVIFDESTKIKSGNTKRHDYLKRLMLLCTDRRMNLSGGPSPNGLTDLFWQYWFLDGGSSLGKSETKFKQAYFDYNKYCMRFEPLPGADLAIFDKIAPITNRLDAEDWLELPELIFNPIRITLPPGLRQEYQTLEKEFFLSLEDGTNVETFSEAATSIKLRQFLQGAVYDANHNPHFIHDIKYQTLEELYSGYPTLCAIQFRFERAFIQKFFGHQAVVMGGTSSVMANQYFDSWNAGKLPMLFVHPASVAHGLNLQEGGHLLTFIGVPWDLEHFHQLIGRLHRSGQVSNVVVTLILFEDTVDEVVYKAIKKKDADQSKLLNALREYSKSYS